MLSNGVLGVLVHACVQSFVQAGERGFYWGVGTLLFVFIQCLLLS